jgi:hypothetical protein
VELVAACRLVLVLWLGIAGILKLGHLRAFRRAVHHYRVLPHTLAGLYAMLVGPAEIVAATLLLCGVAIGAGSVLAALLVASFAIAVGVNLRRGRDLDCHCFGGALRMRIGAHTLAVDLLLLLPAIGLAWRASTTSGIVAMAWPLVGAAPSALSMALGLAYAAGLGLLYLPGLRHPVLRRSSSSHALAPSVQEE